MDWEKIDVHLASALGESSFDAVFAVFVDRRDSLTPSTAMVGREQIAELSHGEDIVRIRLAQSQTSD